MGPSVYHPRLWRISRKGLALGMAIGIFFGLLIPIAQIPFSAALAVVLRANVPAAMASTLVTNPVTFAPVYYLAYQTGQLVLGDAESQKPKAASPQAGLVSSPVQRTEGRTDQADKASWAMFWDHVTGVGRPLVVGLALFAVVGGFFVYALASLGWVAHVRLKRRRRLRQASGAQ
jgi:hypothetical protein